MFDIERLRKTCLQPMDDFKKEGEAVECTEGFYVYKDNGADILAVAHLDTVQDTKHFYVVRMGGYEIVFNHALDDRLGAYIILDILPKLGVNCDVLLTTGEESCNSTAQAFKTTKQYKWIFSFDRMGTDVVLYQYGGKAIENILEGLNNVVGMGSYSDICDLSDLGCVGINWGCGYWDNHGPKSHVILTDAEYMVNQFKAFYDLYKDTLFDWEDDGYGDDVGWMGYSRGWGQSGRHLSDLEWDDRNVSRTAGLDKMQKEIYHSTYRDLICRGWDDGMAHGAALDEVAYTIDRMNYENGDVVEGDYKEVDEWTGDNGECLVCGRPECLGMLECGKCHSQFHDNPTVVNTGHCALCLRNVSKGELK
jgi:hypothetical protein